MKKSVLTFIFLLVFIVAAFADNFQISFSDANGRRYYLSYSAVKVFDSRNRQVFRGSTDRYGRLIINIGKGSYRLEISSGNKTCKKTISIDNNRQFKQIIFTSRDCINQMRK